MSKVKEQFVSYEIALKLKELGFDEECLGSYCQTPKFDEGTFSLGREYSIKAPLWQQVIAWFRDNYDIHIGFAPYTNPSKGIVNILYEYSISTKENSYEGGMENSTARLQEGLKSKKPSYINLFNTYEEAREQAILKVIELKRIEISLY